MRFADAEKTVLIINEHVQLMGIREAVHRYVVNGRTPRRLSEPGFMGFTGFCQTSCHPYQESGHPQGVSLQLTYFRILLQKPRFFRFFHNYDNYARIPPKKMVFNAQLGDCARL